MECAIQEEGPPVLISHGNGGGYDQGLELPEDYPLHDIKVHTLVVHAVDDSLQPLFHGEYTASNIPGAQFLKLESGGHFSVGRVEVVRTEITTFLNRIYGT